MGGGRCEGPVSKICASNGHGVKVFALCETTPHTHRTDTSHAGWRSWGQEKPWPTTRDADDNA